MKKTTNISFFSLLLAIMVALAAAKGLYHPDVYLNIEPGCLRLLGNQDFVILAIFVPLLFLSTWLSAQTHFRGTLIWIGTVGYLNYVYSGYAFGGVSQELLLLLHVAISGLSFFLLAIKLAKIDPEEFRLKFIPVTPLRFTAFFLMAIAFFIEGIWLQEIIPFLKPFHFLPRTGWNRFLAIQVLDLAFLGPLCFLAGLWLFFHKAAGYVLTAGLLVIITVKFGTMISDLNSIIIQDKAGLIFTFLTLVSLSLLVCFLKKLKEEKLTSYHNRISDHF